MIIKNLFRYWTFQVFAPGTVLREKYESFKILLAHDKAAHEHMATLEDIYYNKRKCDFNGIISTYDCFADSVSGMVDALLKMNPTGYWSLKAYYKKFDFYIRFMLAPPEFDFSPPFTLSLKNTSLLTESMGGKKAFVLSRINTVLHLPTPAGFVITTNAFHYFLEVNDLRGTIIKTLAQLDITDPVSLGNAARKIKNLILRAPVPEPIVAAIQASVETFKNSEKKDFRVAVRSSAVKEDGSVSFAGQYKTILNVPASGILDGYKKVIAGKYSPEALFYRINHGILDDETPMAALIIEMVDSKSSGVVYTRDLKKGDLTPDEIKKDRHETLLIHSVWGQGELLVDGNISPDVIKVSKEKGGTVFGIHTEPKKEMMVPGADGRTDIIPTDPNKQNLASLDEVSIRTLSGFGIKLETYYNCPQDIEWCRDQDDNIFILQSRPLNPSSPRPALQIKKKERIINPVICSGGETVSGGTGTGRVFHLDDVRQWSRVPKGSVLVVRTATPKLVTTLHTITAVIIKKGTPSSHFASVAREFGIPSVVNISQGFEDLAPGEIVTVDANHGIVYEGKIPQWQDTPLPGDPLFDSSAFMTKLKYVINFTSRLKLTNPSSPDFIPEGCRSLHDIIRFSHETAVKEMFLLGSRKAGRKKGAKKLIPSIPLLFYVLDVGQGIKNKSLEKEELVPSDINCLPMKVVLKGLLDPEICWTETRHFDWESYDKIVMAGGIISPDDPQFGSYAVVSEEYMNINFRFGYHFVILDTICSPSKSDNHILFRFSGGGGDPSGRGFRAEFIRQVLNLLGFSVQVKSDLVDAQLHNESLETMEKILEMIGRLLGATKLMDMYLNKSMDLASMADEFIKGRSDFRSISDHQEKN